MTTTTITPRTEAEAMSLHPDQILLYDHKTLDQAFKAVLALGLNTVLSHTPNWYDLAASGARKVIADQGYGMNLGETIALWRVCREAQIEATYYAALDELLATGGEVWDDATRAASTRLDRQRAGRYGMLARHAPVPPTAD